MSAAVAVTGATGLIGRNLRLRLRDRDVVLLTRTRPELLPNERWLRVDLAEPFSLDGLPAGSVLYHLAYSHAAGRHNLDYTTGLVEAVVRHGALGRVIHASSVSVYGERRSGIIDEETPCAPNSSYARTKYAVEEMLTDGLRSSCQLMIVRPTAVVGEGGPALRSLVEAAVHRPVVGMVKRSVQHRAPVHFVAVGTVAAALRFLLERRLRDSPEVYVVADDDQPENASYAAIQDAVRAACGLAPLPTVPLPDWTLRPLSRVSGRSLGVVRRFSAAKLTEAGFRDVSELGDEIQGVVLRQLRSSGRAAQVRR